MAYFHSGISNYYFKLLYVLLMENKKESHERISSHVFFWLFSFHETYFGTNFATDTTSTLAFLCWFSMKYVRKKNIAKTSKKCCLGVLLGQKKVTPKIKVIFFCRNNKKRSWAFKNFFFYQNINEYQWVIIFYFFFQAKILVFQKLESYWKSLLEMSA